MKTRTRNGIVVAGALALMAAGFAWAARQRSQADLRARSLDAIPSGALLVATADLDALRASPAFAPILRDGREIPGLGKVREVCGFDPMDTLHELAVAIPAAGEDGEFGIVAAGDVQDEALLACAAKVIEARGGRASVTSIGGFKTVRDATLAATGGEIAVRKGGPVLLGAGTYLRAMIDAAEGRGPTIRSSVAHSHLAREIGRATLRVTVVLTPEQRRTLEAELTGRAGGAPKSGEAPLEKAPPGGSITAGALGVDIGADVSLHGVLLCDNERACGELAGSLRSARDARASDFGTRLVGIGAALERIQIDAEGEQIHARVALPAVEAIQLVERMLALRGLRHPMPSERGAGAGAGVGAPTGTGAPTDAATDAATDTDAGPGSDAGPKTGLPAPDEVIKADPKDPKGSKGAGAGAPSPKDKTAPPGATSQPKK